MATPPLTFNIQQTAILMADFHREGMGDNPMVQERGTVQKARAVLEAARQAGVAESFCRPCAMQRTPIIAWWWWWRMAVPTATPRCTQC
jgi:hypothetical protein